jgi:hypothetical protein
MTMDASQSLAILYQIIFELKGKVAAKAFIETAVYNAISEIEEDNLEVTAKEIDKRLARMVTNFKDLMDKPKKSIA